MPPGLEPADEHFALAVLVLQHKYFRPFAQKLFQLLDDKGAAILRYILGQCGKEAEVFLWPVRKRSIQRKKTLYYTS